MRTITQATRIDSLFRDGRRVSHPALLVLVLPTEHDGAGGVLFVAGKRLGSAVQRNRSKRVLREAVRRAGGPWAGLDIALVAREATAAAAPATLDQALSKALMTIRDTP